MDRTQVVSAASQKSNGSSKSKTSCPAASSFERVSRIALWTGGCGLTMPSVGIIPILSFCDGVEISFQNPSIVVGSYGSDGCVRISLARSFRSSMLWQQGPADTIIDVLPGATANSPCRGTRAAVGLMAYSPLNAPGALMLPPISVVIGAAGTPLKAQRTASPPEDPPEPKAEL